MKRIVAFLAAVFLGITCALCGCSSGVAQVVLDFEQQEQTKIEELIEKNPTMAYTYNSKATEVYCWYWIEDVDAVDGLIEKYNFHERFNKATVKTGYGSISLTFAREDFTESVHRNLQRIQEGDPQIRSLHIEVRGCGAFRKTPKIECYAENPVPFEYEVESALSSLRGDTGAVIKSKQEYDAYLDVLIEEEWLDGIKENIERKKQLFTEEFFEENALIISKVIVRGTTAVNLTLENAYLSGEKVYVVVSSSIPRGIMPAAKLYMTFALTVKKSAVADVTEVITLD